MLGLGPTEILLITLVGVIILYMIYGRERVYNIPPGPTQLPIIGNLLTFMLSKSPVQVKLTELAKTYGPIFSLRFGNQKAVVINNIQLANEALLTKPTDFAGRPDSYSMDILTEGRKNIALADHGPIWRLQRKISSKALRKYLSGTELEVRVHKSLSKILTQIEAEKGAFEPREYMSLFVLNFISAFCFGKSDIQGSYYRNITYVRQELSWKDHMGGLKLKRNQVVGLKATEHDSVLEQSANGLPEDFIPALRHLKLKRSQSFLEMVEQNLKFIYGKYSEHQATFDEANIRDFVDCLIASEKEAHQEEEDDTVLSKLTNTHFVQVVADIFAAGLDTSRFTLYWSILHVCRWPEIQEKVHKEIIEYVGTSRLPGIDDWKHLSYTEATLCESMRLGSVVPIGLPHCAMVNGQIGGYDVPKGTLVVINHFGLHFDPTFWGDPENFRPERFLDEQGNLGPKPENFIPFSMGRRVCLGEAVAKPELLIMFAGLLQKFKFSLAPGEKGSLEHVGGISGLIPSAYKVLAEPRF